MNKSIIALAVMGIVATGSTYAGNLKGSVGITSDNVFRGTSVNEEKVSAFGDINYSIGNITLGATAANFATTGSDVELTAYANYRIALSKEISVDVGTIHYNYPGQSDINTTEFSAAGNIQLGKIGGQLKVSYSDDYFGSGDNNWYTELNGSLGGLPWGLTAIAHYGRHDGNLIADNFEDYKLGVTKNIGKNIVVEAAWFDTNQSGKYLDDRWVVSAKYAF